MPLGEWSGANLVPSCDEQSDSRGWGRHLLQIGNNPIQKEDAHADDYEKRDIELHIPPDIIYKMDFLSVDNYSS